MKGTSHVEKKGLWFSQNLMSGATMQSVEGTIVARIYGKGRGWSFCPKDFQDLGGRSSIDDALSNLCRKGTIRRVARGVYDYPRSSKALGMEAPPDLDQVAHALARNRGWSIQATGDWAANLLGLSPQVPAKIVYLSTGPAKSVTVANTAVEFRPASPKDVQDGRPGLVIQALKGRGRERIDETTIQAIRERITDSDCRKLRSMRRVTSWVYEAIRRICSERHE